jgi:sortase A
VRRRIQVLAWTLIWSGVFITGYLGWELFVTDVLNRGVQTAAHADLVEVIGGPEPPGEEIDSSDFLGSEVPPGLPEAVRLISEPQPEPGEAMAFIRIPTIGVDQVVFSGVDRQTLKSGPGHMEWTPLPGQPGNAVISGHRTTYGRPFYDLDQLVAGDRIEVESQAGVHGYEVREVLIVQPTDVWVTDDRPGGWLTLTTCHPKFSARERLVIVAEMVDGPNLDYIKLHQIRFG